MMACIGYGVDIYMRFNTDQGLNLESFEFLRTYCEAMEVQRCLFIKPSAAINSLTCFLPLGFS